MFRVMKLGFFSTDNPIFDLLKCSEVTRVPISRFYGQVCQCLGCGYKHRLSTTIHQIFAAFVFLSFNSQTGRPFDSSGVPGFLAFSSTFCSFPFIKTTSSYLYEYNISRLENQYMVTLLKNSKICLSIFQMVQQICRIPWHFFK